MDGLVAGEFSIAEKIDRHQMSFVEGQAEEATLEMRIKTEAELRLSAARQAAASEQSVRDRRQQYTVQAQIDAQARTRHLQLCEAAGWQCQRALAVSQKLWKRDPCKSLLRGWASTACSCVCAADHSEPHCHQPKPTVRC